MIKKLKLKIKNLKIFNLFQNRGFTVLESIVAIFVLSLSISGAFAAVRQGLHQANLSKEEVRAFYLAQEAVEIVRNKRDANQLTKINTGGGNWLDGITQGLGSCPFSTNINKNTCTVDAVSFQIYHCGTGNWGTCVQNLKQDSTTFLYGYASGNATNFNREVQIESISADEIVVIVRITWTKGLLTKEFKVKTHFFNWI